MLMSRGNQPQFWLFWYFNGEHFAQNHRFYPPVIEPEPCNARWDIDDFLAEHRGFSIATLHSFQAGKIVAILEFCVDSFAS